METTEHLISTIVLIADFMTYFDDLTPHTYTARKPEDGVLNIGWLGREHPFPTGDTPAEFAAKLGELCSRPIHLHRGFHVCEFCFGSTLSKQWPRIGNGQIRVCGFDGVWYSSPTMIFHYVTEHSYLPPDAFIAAVMNPKLVSDPCAEHDFGVWEADVRKFFPDWQTDPASLRWQSAKPRLEVGQTVDGRVVARAPSEIWLDIGVGFPATLPVKNLLAVRQTRFELDNFAPKGTQLSCTIQEVGSDCRIILSQV